MIAVKGLAHRYGGSEALRLAEWRVAQGERWPCSALGQR